MQDTLESTNLSGYDHYFNITQDDLISNGYIQGFFSLLYGLIFILGIIGNVMVCYIVFRNKSMHTVTNFFITNLAFADILLCILTIPFTPIYTFQRQWIFGAVLCRLVASAQGCSIYISALTLTSIAMDRFFVIIYPFQPRMKQTTCIFIIIIIWIISLVLMLPYSLYIETFKLTANNQTREFCEENWPSDQYRKIYGGITTILQFLIPFIVISICYISVSIRLNLRIRSKPGSKTTKKDETDRERKKRTNRMLIAMVTVFGFCWLPLNIFNMINDFHDIMLNWPLTNFMFFITHTIAVSSTLYNPLLYAWMNENFRKEFKMVLPNLIGRKLDTKKQCTSGVGSWQPDPLFTCNIDTVQESIMTSSYTKSTLHSIGHDSTHYIELPNNNSNPDSERHTSIQLADINNIKPIQIKRDPAETVIHNSGVMETNFQISSK